MGQVDRGSDDQAVLLLGRHLGDEGLVDLELIDRQPLQIGERREPGAEIIDRDPHAHRLQGGQHLERLVRIGHQGALRDFQRQPLRRHRVGLEHAGDAWNQLGILQVTDRQVYGHPKGDPLAPPPVLLLHRRLEHAAPERPDQPRLLRQRNESNRRQHPVARMRPAHQRFDADHVATSAAKHRLIVKRQRILFDRPAQLEGQRQAAGIDVVFEGIEGDPGARALRLIHGRVRASEQGVRILRVAGKERDPDAGSDLERLVLDHQRLLEGLQDARGRRARRGFVDDAREDDRELVATQAGDGVRFPQLALEPVRNVTQDVVAAVVPEGVVDLLEPVEVHHQQGQRMVFALAGQDGLPQTVEHQRSVGKIRQAVVEGQMLEGDLLFLSRRDVLGHDDEKERFVRRTAHQ